MFNILLKIQCFCFIKNVVTASLRILFKFLFDFGDGCIFAFPLAGILIVKVCQSVLKTKLHKSIGCSLQPVRVYFFDCVVG